MECFQSEEVRETLLVVLTMIGQDGALEIIITWHIPLLYLILPVTIHLLLFPFVHLEPSLLGLECALCEFCGAGSNVPWR